MPRSLARLAAAGSVLLILSGCGFESLGSGAGASITVADLWKPASGYALETDDAYTLSRAGCLETLVTVDERSEPQPGLATSWTQVTPTSWLFTVREATFQNGTPLTAAVVADDLDRLLTAAAPPRSFSPKIVRSVRALDNRTVQIDTPSPDQFLPLRLSVANTGILAPQAFTGASTDPVGTCTGPFRITSTHTGDSLSLVRNDRYWGLRPTLDAVTIRYADDGGTRATQLRSGEVDVAANLPVVNRASLLSDDSVRLHDADLPRTTGLYLNVRRAPFDRLAARQAVQAAINLDVVVDGVYDGRATAAAGPFNPGEPWAPTGATPVRGGPDEARAIMRRAGIDPESLGFELIAYSDRPEFSDLAQVLQAQLGAAGIPITIRTGDYAAVEADLIAGNFGATLLSRNHLIDMPDPIGLLRSDYTCQGSFNIAGYCRPDIDAMVTRAAGTTDRRARYAIYTRIAEQMQDDVAFVPLVHEALTVGINAGVHGVRIGSQEQYLLTPETSTTPATAP